jgi:hypothetical protein
MWLHRNRCAATLHVTRLQNSFSLRTWICDAARTTNARYCQSRYDLSRNHITPVSSSGKTLSLYLRNSGSIPTYRLQIMNEMWCGICGPGVPCNGHPRLDQLFRHFRKPLCEWCGNTESSHQCSCGDYLCDGCETRHLCPIEPDFGAY